LPFEITTYMRIAAAFVCVFVFSTTAYAQSDSIDQIVVTVDGEPITETDIQRRVRALAFEAGQDAALQFDENRFRRQAIDDAITFTVQNQFARYNGIFIDPVQVRERIGLLAQQAQMSTEQYFQQFSEIGLGESDVIRLISEQLLLELLLQRVLAQRISIHPEEVDRFLNLNREQFSATMRQYNLVAIAITTPITADAELLQSLRQLIVQIHVELKNGADFIDIAQAVVHFDGVDSGSLGWVSVEDMDPKLAAEVTAASVGEHVGPIQLDSNTLFVRIEGRREVPGFSPDSLLEFHLARIVLHASTDAGAQTVVNELDKIRENILQGGDFGALAKLYSHDTDSKPDGGDLGWVPEDELAYEYRSLLPNMQPGDISQAQRVGNSAFILKLIEVREANHEERVRSYIRGRIRENKLLRERTKWVDNLRSNAAIKYQTVF